jgi:tellurite resistance protein TehA-like permease
LSANNASPLSPKFLHPGNFALVMASGIIAIGMRRAGFAELADVLCIFAVVAWLTLLALSLWRVACFKNAIWAELCNPRMVFSYFTLVAATNIIGLLLLDHGYSTYALFCWLLAFAAWCSLLYLAFSVLTFLSHEHNVNIVHGGWLITIVGTQSLVILGIQLTPHLGIYAGYMMVEVHMLWGLGLIFYGIFVTLFCYRIFFLNLEPEDISPLLWVIMGAAAISASAGIQLLETHSPIAILEIQKPFISGVTMMLWSWATWWLPMLFLFSLWKHVFRKLPLHYEPILWSFVFPLGMYAVASSQIGELARFAPMQWISHSMIWVAFAAWTMVLLGLLGKLLLKNHENLI